MKKYYKNQFSAQVSSELSTKLETIAYEIDRETDNIARMINTNINFNNARIQQRFKKLAELVESYDAAKDEVSNTVVLPEAAEKWGKTSDVSWSLNYSTCIVTVTYNGETKYQTIKLDADVDASISTPLKHNSVELRALQEIYDKCAASYPTLDNQSYTEFETYLNTTEAEVNKLKAEVDSEYVSPWLNSYCFEHGIAANTVKCNWNLTYDTRSITVTIFGDISNEFKENE